MSGLTSNQLQKAKQAIEILSTLSVQNSEPTLVVGSSASTSEANTNSETQEGSYNSSFSFFFKGLFIVLAAADRVLLQLNQQKGNRCKRKAKEEVRSLFNKGKKPKSASKCSWKHKFVCLAYHDQTRIPTTDTEKDDLLQAGLGEKEIGLMILKLVQKIFVI